MEFHAAVKLSSKITRKLLLTSEKSVAFFYQCCCLMSNKISICSTIKAKLALQLMIVGLALGKTRLSFCAF
jgi:hypothetical protein